VNLHNFILEGAKMNNINLADVTFHVDENLDAESRAKLEDDLRAQEGVVSIHSSEKTPHLIVVTYDPGHARSKELLQVVLGENLHAEMIGL
jgi:hypothetical protein